MNTDDENREEFTREAQRNQSLRASNPDLTNGNLICTFKPAELEDLRRENSFSFGGCLDRFHCFYLLKSKIQVHKDAASIDFQENEPELNLNSQNSFSLYNNRSNINVKETESRINDTVKNDSSCYCYNIYKAHSSNCVSQTSNNSDEKNSTTAQAFLKKKRKHYTARRAPGMISHLLPLQRIDSLITHTKLKENNINLKSKVLLKQTNFNILDNNSHLPDVVEKDNNCKYFNNTLNDNPESLDNVEGENVNDIHFSFGNVENCIDSNNFNYAVNYKNITYV